VTGVSTSRYAHIIHSLNEKRTALLSVWENAVKFHQYKAEYEEEQEEEEDGICGVDLVFYDDSLVADCTKSVARRGAGCNQVLQGGGLR
jgi:hypothetical protein